MGNKVNIKLNSDFYFPTQTIQGIAIIESSESLLKEVSRLYLHLQGEEFYNTNPWFCASLDGYNIFCSQFKLLKDLQLENNNVLLQKTIVFPFTYKLDENLAGSISWDIEDKYKIVYTLSLLAESQQGDRIVLKQVPLEIKQFSTIPRQMRHFQSSKAIKGYFNQYLGICKIDCDINGEEFNFGDQLDLELTVDQRESKKCIEDIQISLIKKITINGSTRKVIEKQIQSHSLPGVIQGIITTFKKSIVLFDFQNKMLSSTSGQIIKLEYILRIQAYSTWFNLNNNDLVIDIPVRLYQRLIKLQDLNFSTLEIPDLFHQYPVVNL